MKCFNHPSAEAIGICRACSKGLCHECAADLGYGLACKNTHVAEVENLNALISRNLKITSVSKKGKFVVPAFFAFIGLVFLG